MTTAQNRLLWFVGLAVSGTGMYMLYRKYTDRLTSSIKRNRIIFGCRQDACALLYGTETVKFDVPMYSKSFYAQTEKTAINAKIATIRAAYGTTIDRIAKLVNLPANLIMSFVFIESAGNANAVGGKAIGLMQIDPVAAHAMIWLENKKGRLSNEEKAVLRRYLGARLDKILADKWMNQTQYVAASDLYNAEFNLLAGSIYLGILVDESTENGYLRLDKIVSRYNRGYFTKPVGDKNMVLAAQPGITQSYILKLAGANGVLDILTA